MTHDEIMDRVRDAEADPDELAALCAAEAAEALGVTLGGRRYTHAETGTAAGWDLAGNRHGARLAVNVEYEPYVLIETGPAEEPVYHLELRHFDGLGWVESAHGGPVLVNPHGDAHPVLR